MCLNFSYFLVIFSSKITINRSINQVLKSLLYLGVISLRVTFFFLSFHSQKCHEILTSGGSRIFHIRCTFYLTFLILKIYSWNTGNHLCFKLAFNLFGFSRPFMKNKKTFYLRCGRDRPKTNWKDTMMKKKF